MPNELDPQVDQWYTQLDKRRNFYVTAVDEIEGTIDVQHSDGDIEEFSLDEWRAMEIDLGEEPENWAGAFDAAEPDDLGTAITDTAPDDWEELQEEFHADADKLLALESDEEIPD